MEDIKDIQTLFKLEEFVLLLINSGGEMNLRRSQLKSAGERLVHTAAEGKVHNALDNVYESPGRILPEIKNEINRL